ncbi:unnamed protein product [Trichobilharzia regenti]|nr:unnamed protein product [Trichobilharzia regenti]
MSCSFVSLVSAVGYPLLMIYPTTPVATPTVSGASDPIYDYCAAAAAAAAAASVASQQSNMPVDPSDPASQSRPTDSSEQQNCLLSQFCTTPLVSINAAPALNNVFTSLFPGTTIAQPANLCFLASSSSDPTVLIRHQILHQVEFYFSADNLARDIYLRRQMDSDGWVDVNVIAKFNRVASVCKCRCIASKLTKRRLGEGAKLWTHTSLSLLTAFNPWIKSAVFDA